MVEEDDGVCQGTDAEALEVNEACKSAKTQHEAHEQHRVEVDGHAVATDNPHQSQKEQEMDEQADIPDGEKHLDGNHLYVVGKFLALGLVLVVFVVNHIAADFCLAGMQESETGPLPVLAHHQVDFGNYLRHTACTELGEVLEIDHIEEVDDLIDRRSDAKHGTLGVVIAARQGVIHKIDSHKAQDSYRSVLEKAFDTSCQIEHGEHYSEYQREGLSGNYGDNENRPHPPGALEIAHHGVDTQQHEEHADRIFAQGIEGEGLPVEVVESGLYTAPQFGERHKQIAADDISVEDVEHAHNHRELYDATEEKGNIEVAPGEAGYRDDKINEIEIVSQRDKLNRHTLERVRGQNDERHEVCQEQDDGLPGLRRLAVDEEEDYGGNRGEVGETDARNHLTVNQARAGNSEREHDDETIAVVAESFDKKQYHKKECRIEAQTRGRKAQHEEHGHIPLVLFKCEQLPPLVRGGSCVRCRYLCSLGHTSS